MFSVKTKVKISFIAFIFVALIAFVIYFRSNYAVLVQKIEDKDTTKTNMITESDCDGKIFQEVQKIRNVNDFYENNKNVYKVIIQIENISDNLGLKRDQSDDFYELFKNFSKVNIFSDLKIKYSIIYENSYKLPLYTEIIEKIQKTISYKKFSFKKLFILDLKGQKDKRFYVIINLINEKNFIEAENIYNTIAKDYNIDLDNTQEVLNEKENPNAKNINFNIEIFKSLSSDIHILSSIQEMKNEIFRILKDSIEHEAKI